ncbi:MAG TPA: CHRD domain-containing protein [Nocardioidaceae bacterium]
MVRWTTGGNRRGGALAMGVALLAGSALTAGVAPSAAAGAQAAPTRLEASLQGSSAADPDGQGEAVLRLFKGKRKVCATVSWSKIATPTAAHIHRRSDGGIVVDLTGSVTGGPRCARKVPGAVIRRLVNNPNRYYFNVHNDPYPAGAIEGTLRR